MKNQFKFAIAALMLAGCNQLANVEPTNTIDNPPVVENAPKFVQSNSVDLLPNIGVANAVAATTTTYTSSPSIGMWTVGSNGNLNLSCAKFQSGLKAKVTSINGDNVNVQIQKTDGKAFGVAGTAYSKATTPCGTVAGSSSWTRTDYNYIDVSFKLTFTSGTVAFYPSITLKNGILMYANPITFTAKTVVQTEYFVSPVSVSPYSYCKFASTDCYKKGHHHTGVDYPGTTSSGAFAIGDGTVVGVEYMSKNDHGMGNNVIISHKLENGTTIYSTYSHLSSISVSNNQKITKGIKVGNIGGTGNGSSSTWGPHLHFEIKSCAKSGSCWNGDFWGYSSKHPTTLGYLDPDQYIGKVKFIKN